MHPAPIQVRQPGGDGARARRLRVTGQRYYWRHTKAILDVALPLVVVNASGQAAAMLGPQAVGERWTVQQVQISTSSQAGQIPYVIQQAAGSPIPPPPPIVAQVWLAIAGQQVHQLGQTTAGGQDAIGIDWAPVETGEQIAVVWFGAAPGDNANALIRGLKTVLDT